MHIRTHSALKRRSCAQMLAPCVLCPNAQGKTGFHMGAMDASELLPEDAEAMASTVGRAARVFSTPQYKEMVVNCISQVRACARNVQSLRSPLCRRRLAAD